jgi:4-diphosphocytidyl-2-C-methyl-D-erythritol kinase
MTQAFAPAKINLYLHVTGRRADGYHLLDSLVAFADIGDTLEISPAEEFSFSVRGPFAAAFTPEERAGSRNLAARAALTLAQAMGREPRFALSLTKNLPLAAGMGGGSADAAAAIRAVLAFWKTDADSLKELPALLLSLGADVPACLRGAPARMEGVGDILRAVPAIPALPLVLVNPGTPCPTPDVFRAFEGPFSAPVSYPAAWKDAADFRAFLAAQRNDLTQAAVKIAPATEDALAALRAQKSCRLARMTGSGATCFGLFESAQAAQDAATAIAGLQPGWWVKAGMAGGA